MVWKQVPIVPCIYCNNPGKNQKLNILVTEWDHLKKNNFAEEIIIPLCYWCHATMNVYHTLAFNKSDKLSLYNCKGYDFNYECDWFCESFFEKKFRKLKINIDLVNGYKCTQLAILEINKLNLDNSSIFSFLPKDIIKYIQSFLSK